MITLSPQYNNSIKNKSLPFCLSRSGLSDERTTEEKNTIVDEFYRRLEAEFVRAPEDYKKELVAAAVSVKKLN